MAYTQTQKDALEKALASGVTRVTYDGKTVEYRSLAEIKEALKEVSNALTVSSGKTVTRQVRVYASKGL